MSSSDALTELPAVDLSCRYVRVIEERVDGLVSFEFSIGWPELALELMLPASAFREFCRVNAVTFLTDTPPPRGKAGEIEV